MPVNTLFQVLTATATVFWLHGLFHHKCQRTSRLFLSLWEHWSWLILWNLRECCLCSQKGLKEAEQGGEFKILTLLLQKRQHFVCCLLRSVTRTREKLWKVARTLKQSLVGVITYAKTKICWWEQQWMNNTLRRSNAHMPPSCPLMLFICGPVAVDGCPHSWFYGFGISSWYWYCLFSYLAVTRRRQLLETSDVSSTS